MAAAAALAVAVAGLTGCASPPSPSAARPAPPPQRLALARTLAAEGGLSLTQLPTTPPLVAALPTSPPSRAAALVVYIEGDGHAWRTPEWPSEDPTPLNPVALRLAARHGGGNAVWLARPCQYTQAARADCTPARWTGGRYAPAAVAQVGAALDLLKARYGAPSFTLVGYSGGGTLAALVAAGRADVAALVTVGANLHLGEWLRHHGLPPMPDAGDPAALGAALGALPQLHLAGERDRTVPPSIARAYLRALGGPATVHVLEVPGYDHVCCWAQAWPALPAHAWPGPGNPWRHGLAPPAHDGHGVLPGVPPPARRLPLLHETILFVEEHHHAHRSQRTPAHQGR